MQTGILCLGSLARCIPGGSLTLFEDGTLTDADVAELHERLGPEKIVRRAEMDGLMDTLLARHPVCRKYRDAQPFGIKLFDIPHWLRNGGLYFDSDILFFQRIDLADVVEAARDRFVFMEDVTQGYSGSLWSLAWRHRLKLPSKINAGILAVPANLHDLDFIEWFLSVPGFHAIPYLVEQTCYAAMAGMRCAIVDPRQIGMITDKTKGPDGRAALHFIAHQKGRMAEFSKYMAHMETGPPVRLALCEPRILGLNRILMHSIGRRLPFFSTRIP